MNRIKRLKVFSLILAGVFATQLAYSQGDYVPGYVINNDLDTIFGFVESKNWVINPVRINFKTSMESEPVSYSPTEIVEFSTGEKSYISGIVDVEVTSVQLGELTDNPQLDLRIDTVFLLTISQGAKSLYYYMNSQGRVNYYIMQEDGLELLVYKRYLRMINGKRVLTENKKYLGQLRLYLNDCEKVKSKLENVTYDENSLSKLFQLYNECTSSENVFQKKEEKVQIEYGALGGVTLTSLNFEGDGFAELIKADFDKSYNPTVGLYLEIRLPNYMKKFSFYNELLLTTYKVKGTYLDYTHEDFYSSFISEIGSTTLKINNLIRYTYPIGNSSVFINAGISSGLAANETNHQEIDSKFYGTIKHTEDKAVNEIRMFEPCYIIGTGVKYDKFSLEIRYEKGNGMSKAMSLESSTKRLYLLLGYNF